MPILKAGCCSTAFPIDTAAQVKRERWAALGWSERAATFETLVARAPAQAIDPLVNAAGVVAGAHGHALPTMVRIASGRCP